MKSDITVTTSSKLRRMAPFRGVDLVRHPREVQRVTLMSRLPPQDRRQLERGLEQAAVERF